LRGGVVYHDGQFDDARLAINLAQTAVEQKAIVLNYFKVKALLKANDKISGVQVSDQISGKEYEVKGKIVINATGVFFR
jgi:glycerol-3-phosphate dehydrogenase